MSSSGRVGVSAHRPAGDMARRLTRLRPCSRADGRVRLAQATLYLEVAEMAMTDEQSEHTTVATGNAVLAAIAASDALCCALSGQHHRGEDHRAAADYLEEVTGDRQLAAALRDALDLKDSGHYGLANMSKTNAAKAIRRARKLVDAATEALRGGAP